MAVDTSTLQRINTGKTKTLQKYNIAGVGDTTVINSYARIVTTTSYDFVWLTEAQADSLVDQILADTADLRTDPQAAASRYTASGKWKVSVSEQNDPNWDTL